MTIAKQLALSLTKEIIAAKRKRNIVPEYALQTEIHEALSDALASLVKDNTLSTSLASVNRITAYSITIPTPHALPESQTPCQPPI